MKAFHRARRLTAAVLVAPLLALTGCAVNIDEVPISESFPVGSHPTPECVRAAKEASYYCPRTSPTNTEAQFKCDHMRWEYARKC